MVRSIIIFLLVVMASIYVSGEQNLTPDFFYNLNEVSYDNVTFLDAGTFWRINCESNGKGFEAVIDREVKLKCGGCPGFCVMYGDYPPDVTPEMLRGNAAANNPPSSTNYSHPSKLPIKHTQI